MDSVILQVLIINYHKIIFYLNVSFYLIYKLKTLVLI